MDEDSAQTM